MTAASLSFQTQTLQRSECARRSHAHSLTAEYSGFDPKYLSVVCSLPTRTLESFPGRKLLLSESQHAAGAKWVIYSRHTGPFIHDTSVLTLWSQFGSIEFTLNRCCTNLSGRKLAAHVEAHYTKHNNSHDPLLLPVIVHLLLLF